MASTTAAAPGRSEWDGGVSPMGVSYGKAHDVVLFIV